MFLKAQYKKPLEESSSKSSLDSSTNDCHYALCSIDLIPLGFPPIYKEIYCSIIRKKLILYDIFSISSFAVNNTLPISFPSTL